MSDLPPGTPRDASGPELPPDQAPAADLPVHARERLARMRGGRLFTSDLSVNEFLLVKQAGFEPLGMVMGSSIYHVRPPSLPARSCEVESLTGALYHARDLAMTRMEEEADALGADGVIGVRLDLNLHAWGSQVLELVAVGTAVKHAGGHGYRNRKGKPFTSDLSGQDFWTLLQAGHRPVGFVFGNCCYYVAPGLVTSYTGTSRNAELPDYTHALYDARELAVERLQDEAEELHATGIVGVTFEEKEHTWQGSFGTGAFGFRGEMIELFVFGTAVVPVAAGHRPPAPVLVIPANPAPTAGGGAE
jgi:uncharacterized protein YbjQ (UPF0145 family)